MGRRSRRMLGRRLSRRGRTAYSHSSRFQARSGQSFRTQAQVLVLEGDLTSLRACESVVSARMPQGEDSERLYPSSLCESIAPREIDQHLAERLKPGYDPGHSGRQRQDRACGLRDAVLVAVLATEYVLHRQALAEQPQNQTRMNVDSSLFSAHICIWPSPINWRHPRPRRLRSGDQPPPRNDRQPRARDGPE